MDLDDYYSPLVRRLSMDLGTRPIWRIAEMLRRRSADRYRENGASSTIIRDFDGNVKMTLDRSEVMESYIYWHGCWSRNQLGLLDKMLLPHMVFADIGANIGEFTLFAAKRVNGGRVLSFEPQKKLYELLSRNVNANGFSNVTVYNVGVSDKPGTFPLYSSGEEEAHNSSIYGMRHEGLATMYRSDERSSEIGSASFVSFDDVFAESGLSRLDVIKVDVEGAELAVLRSAVGSLKLYHPAILMEWNEETFQAAGYDGGDILALLSDLNYHTFLIGNARLAQSWRYGISGRFGVVQEVAPESLPAFCNIMCR